jgi:putative ABC transport system permease protein
VYLAARQHLLDAFAVLVRADGRDVSADLRAVIQSLGPGLFVGRLGPLDHFLGERLTGYRLLANLTVMFGVIALLIAAIGLNGATTFWVAERTNELGLRAAIGATPASLFRLVVGKGLALTVAGLTIGLAAAFPTAHHAEALLYSFGAFRPTTIGAAAAAVLVVALLASSLPGLRASRLDPLLALRRP